MSSAPNEPAPAKPSPGQARAFQAPTGTRDFYPTDLARLRYIQDAWRRTSINHGFDEIDGPTFEHLDLYTVKSGEGIVSELFSFERFGGEKTYALRPEFTPTLARMYAAKAASLPKPTKWFWMQNCFRAERPQRGRLREFSQWNCDIIGTEFSEPKAQARADAEIIACCVEALRGLGLNRDQVVARIGSRAIVDLILQELGVSADRLDAARTLLDRRERMPTETFQVECTKLDFAFSDFSREARELEGLFSSGVRSEAFGRPDALKKYDFEPIQVLRDSLNELGVFDWCKPDFSIARGLAYYTGMVFEVHEASGAERAIAGGGRYDGLIELFGGPPTPAVGFGMGDVVLSLVLQDKDKFPKDDEIAEKLGLRPDAFIISNGTPEADAQLVPTLAALRRAGEGGLHARRSYKTTKNVGKLLQDAAKSRARFAVIIESATACQLKNLDTQLQEACTLADLPAKIARACSTPKA